MNHTRGGANLVGVPNAFIRRRKSWTPPCPLRGKRVGMLEGKRKCDEASGKGMVFDEVIRGGGEILGVLQNRGKGRPGGVECSWASGILERRGKLGKMFRGKFFLRI